MVLGSGSALLTACSTAAGVGGGATSSSSSKGTIKILLWSHFVPRYDTWFDPWAKKWGQQNGVTVVVDHINQADLPARTAAEFAAGAGHDLIEWITPASAYEPSVHDMTDVVTQAQAKYGNQISFCKQSSFNPKTSKYYAFCHTWTPDPGDYRKGLWTKAGMPGGPATYADLLAGGTQIMTEAARAHGRRNVPRGGLQHGRPRAHLVLRRQRPGRAMEGRAGLAASY